MMNILFCTLAVGTLLATIANDTVPRNCPAGMDEDEFAFLIEDGGYLFKPGTGCGSFLFINSQMTIPQSELEKIRPLINGQVFVPVRFDTKRSPAEVTAEIIDQDGVPALTIYPDEKRATVNVAELRKDAPSAAVLASRTRKEMLRAFSYLMGITGCIPGRILDVMTTMKRLDAAEEEVPGELTLRNKDFLERSGIKAYDRFTYRDACQEGWAPQPTNEYQKAIWDKVHAPPSKPLKITYDKDKQKPVVK